MYLQSGFSEDYLTYHKKSNDSLLGQLTVVFNPSLTKIKNEPRT